MKEKMIMDYHLVFIVLSSLFLILSLIFIWFMEGKQRVYPALLLIGLNLVLSQMCYLGFFGIDVIGYSYDGTVLLNTQSSMYPYFAFFWVIWFLNIILVFYIWYLHTQGVWDVDDEETKKIDWYTDVGV